MKAWNRKSEMIKRFKGAELGVEAEDKVMANSGQPTGQER